MCQTRALREKEASANISVRELGGKENGQLLSGGLLSKELILESL